VGVAVVNEWVAKLAELAEELAAGAGTCCVCCCGSADNRHT